MMSEKVLAWLRKCCCYVENNELKTETAQTEQSATNEETNSSTREPSDLPCGEQLHVKNETNIDISKNTQVLVKNRRTFPTSSDTRRRSLSLMRERGVGVKLPGMGLLRPRSLVEDTQNTDYYNVNFTKRLIRRFNSHRPDTGNTKKQEKQCKLADIDEYETFNTDETSPSSLYDEIVFQESEQNASQDARIFDPNVVGNNGKNNCESDNRIRVNDDGVAYETTPSSDLGSYDDTSLPVVNGDEQKPTTTKSQRSKTLSPIGSDKDQSQYYDNTEWEDNPAYNELQTPYINEPLTLPAVTEELTDTLEWEENVAYVSVQTTYDEKQDDVFEMEWEENPAYQRGGSPLPYRTTASSDASNNNDFCLNSSLGKKKRKRAYTESMIMRQNFQQDLKTAINTRFHKASFPLDSRSHRQLKSAGRKHDEESTNTNIRK